MPWKPLLEGPLATDAETVVRAIARDVAAGSTAAPAERTLFWAYVTSFVDEPFAHAAYDAAMDDLISALHHGVPHAALYDGGLGGIGWTCAHVLDGGAEDVLSVIDEAMVGVVDVERWDASHDLAAGLVGFGVYFLERLANNPDAALAHRGLERVIAHLDRNAHRSDHGATWLTSLDVMPPHYRAEFPDGFYDLGLAHGVPGVCAFLARAARATGHARARSLSGEALHWLALHRSSIGFPSMVPPTFARGSQPEIRVNRTRAAWCYGDPGVAAAVWAESPELARSIALDCAARDEASAGCRDAGLCHGTGGLAHLLNRFYQASGEPALRDSARDWFARTLALRGTEQGFTAYRGEDRPREGLHGLVEGDMGIALALLGAISDAEPSWDRILLVDVGGAS